MIGYLDDPADPAGMPLRIAGPELPDLPSYWFALVLEDLATEATECEQRAAEARMTGNRTLERFCEDQAKMLRRVRANIVRKLKFVGEQ